MNSKTKVEKEIFNSYKEIRKTYDSFQELREELGIPKRTIFDRETMKKDVQAKEFLESIKQVKEKKVKI